MEQHRAVDVGGQVKGGLLALAPDAHNVAAVEGGGGLEYGVGGGHQPGDAPAHTEAGYADAVAVDVGVGDEEIDGGVHIGDDVGVVEVVETVQAGAVQHFLRETVEQVGDYGDVAGFGEAVGHSLIEFVQPADVEGDDYGGVGGGSGAAAGDCGVEIHFRTVDG